MMFERKALFPLILIALSIMLYFFNHLVCGDVYLAFEYNQRWLDGDMPYVDFFEPSPPATILLYTPIVILSRVLNLSFLISNFIALFAIVFMIVLLAFNLGYKSLRSSSYSLTTQLGFFIFVFAILPNENLMQRDYIATLFSIPYILSLVSVVDGHRLNLISRLIAAVLAGICICIKPTFAFFLIFPFLWQIYKKGFVFSLLRIENYIMCAVVALYVFICFHFFPQYFQTEFTIPYLIQIYTKTTAHGELLLLKIEFLSMFFLLAIIMRVLLLKRSVLSSNLVVIALLATLGGACSFCIQAKGFAYHEIPLISFGFMTLFYSMKNIAAPVFAALQNKTITAQGSLFEKIHTMIKSYFANTMLVFKDYSQVIVLMAACVGLTVIFYDKNNFHNPKLPNLNFDIRRFGARPTFMTIGPYFLPMIHSYNGRTVGHFLDQHVILNAVENIQTHPNDNEILKISQHFIDAQRAIVLEDLKNKKPDILLVGSREPDDDSQFPESQIWQNFWLNKNDFKPIMAHYELKQTYNALSIYMRNKDD